MGLRWWHLRRSSHYLPVTAEQTQRFQLQLTTGSQKKGSDVPLWFFTICNIYGCERLLTQCCRWFKSPFHTSHNLWVLVVSQFLMKLGWLHLTENTFITILSRLQSSTRHLLLIGQLCSMQLAVLTVTLRLIRAIEHILCNLSHWASLVVDFFSLVVLCK